MKIPGPDHPITVTESPDRVVVRVGSLTIADTTAALALDEAGCSRVHYLPRDAVDPARIRRTDRVTHCPYKGDASYYSIVTDDGVVENAIWSYEAPYPAVAAIAGRLAFYRDRVTGIDVTPAPGTGAA